MTSFALSGGVRPALSVITSNAGARQPLSTRAEVDMRNNPAAGHSAPGNPGNLFTTSDRTIRAMELAGVLDSIGSALRAIEAAGKGIEALIEIVESAQDLAHRARRDSARDGVSRAELAARFDDLRSRIDQRVATSSYKTINLLDNGIVRIALSEDSSASFTVSGVKFDSVGLGIAAAANDWRSDWDISAALGNLAKGLVALRAQATIFGSDSTLVQTRADFTKSMMDLPDADEPGLVDQDEEAARLVLLNTRQQLATAALSLTTQSEQSILRLF